MNLVNVCHKLTLLVIAVNFFISITYAQNYLPLSYSNLYQLHRNFSSTSAGGGSGSLNFYPTFSVVKDTVIGSQNYFSFNIFSQEQANPFPVDSYVFYDPSSQKLFLKLTESDDIKLGVDFTKPADSTFVSYLRGYPVTFKSLGHQKKFLFNDSVMTFSIFAYWFVTSDPMSRAAKYTFVDNLGLFYCRYGTSYFSHSTDYSLTVISALMDTLTLNPLELSIIDVKPIINTPLNNFPISVTGSYFATFLGLVDTFYLELTQIRDSQPISKWISGFDMRKVATIDPSNLMVGDIIEVKAVIKDKSIHNMIDYYPDTGKVVIEVLEPLGVDSQEFPYDFNLLQNFPNPFNPSTTISFDLPQRSHVELKILNILGSEIITLIDNEIDAGKHSIQFTAENLPSGIYFYRISCGEFIQSRKMMLLK